jgi:Protein of unknown function (DUF2442)
MFLIDVVNVRHVHAHQLDITFADGLCANVDMDKVIKRFSGVFLPLKDEAYFAQVRINPELNTIAWPNGADVYPDVLYSYASGRPIVVNGVRVLN